MKSIPSAAVQRFQQLVNPATRQVLQAYTTSQTNNLEIGCGPGQYRLAVKGSYIGIDITAQDYRGGMPRYLDVVADAMALPFHGTLFDVVFFSNIFHYFLDAEHAVKEAMRALKPEGYLLVFDYSRKTLERLRDTYVHTSPGFTAHPRRCADWEALFEAAGLERVLLSLNTASRIGKWLNFIAQTVPWLRPLYFWAIDHRETEIVLVGRKRASH